MIDIASNIREDNLADDTLLTLTADIVAAHVSNNSVPPSELPMLIGAVFTALSNVTGVEEPEAPKLVPAVPIRSSIKPDFLVCLEDGKKLTMLKRYLSTNFQMTPAEYRTKWGLPKDYPMVAPNYAERRRELAHSIGLGRRAGKKAAAAIEASPPASAAAPKIGRKRLGIKPAAVQSDGGQSETGATLKKPARAGRRKAAP